MFIEKKHKISVRFVVKSSKYGWKYCCHPITTNLNHNRICTLTPTRSVAPNVHISLSKKNKINKIHHMFTRWSLNILLFPRLWRHQIYINYTDRLNLKKNINSQSHIQSTQAEYTAYNAQPFFMQRGILKCIDTCMQRMPVIKM